MSTVDEVQAPSESGSDGDPTAAPVVTPVIPTAEGETAGRVCEVALEEFEGPLDLLLHLVRRHELDVLNIPISFVCEKYLEYIEFMQALDLEVAGDYLVMAATLAYLKSRELVPQPDLVVEEGADPEGPDPREQLIARLLEYQKFKDAAHRLDQRPIAGRDTFGRGQDIELPPLDSGLAPITLFRLAEAYSRVLERARIHKSHEVVLESISVATRMEQLTGLLIERSRFDFERLFLERSWSSEAELRSMLVVTLMSVLELVRMGIARVHQPFDSDTLVVERVASEQDARQALEGYDEERSFGDGSASAAPPDSSPDSPSETPADASAEEVVAEASAEPSATDSSDDGGEAVVEQSVEAAVAEQVVAEAPVEQSVEAVAEEVVAEAPVEQGVEQSVEAAVAEEVVAEAPVEQSVEAVAEEVVAEAPVEQSVEAASEEVVAEAPVEQSVEAVVEPPVDEQSLKALTEELVAEAPVEQSVEAVAEEVVAEASVERSVEAVAEAPVERSAEAPSDEGVAEVTEAPSEEVVAEAPIEAPREEPAEVMTSDPELGAERSAGEIESMPEEAEPVLGESPQDVVEAVSEGADGVAETASEDVSEAIHADASSEQGGGMPVQEAVEGSSVETAQARAGASEQSVVSESPPVDGRPDGAGAGPSPTVDDGSGSTEGDGQEQGQHGEAEAVEGS